MSAQDKIKATVKKVEGKVQEAVGKITDNPEMQAKGEAKQVEGEVQETVEELKDTAKKAVE